MRESLRVPVLRMDTGLPLPAYARTNDAGLDLHAAEAVTLAPGARALVPTGVALAIPAGFAGFVLPRSGLALRHGVTLLNTPGLIDAGYRGEIKVLLVNHGGEPVVLNRGDRVAQLVVQRVEHVALTPVSELPDSARGAGGFGSTGA
jgi:dUTP pyrophosphatase